MDGRTALYTLIAGPIVASLAALLFGIVSKIQNSLQPRVDGEMAGAMDSTGHALDLGYTLFQIGSAIETLVAVVVLAIIVIGFFLRLGN